MNSESYRRVYKYHLKFKDGVQDPGLPYNAEIAHLAMQGGSICMWAVVDIRENAGDRRFIVYGTGHPITTVGKHVGTVLDGQFVWHVFEAL